MALGLLIVWGVAAEPVAKPGMGVGAAKDGKWDRHAIDRKLDELSGLSQTASEADRWFGERGA